MSLPFHLGLRYNRHLLSLVKLDDQPREVLGVAYPEDSDRRARIPLQWGNPTPSPRCVEPATIDQPLPLRSRTILYYQVGPEGRAEIDGGITPLAGARRSEHSGVRERLHLGDHRPILVTDMHSRTAAPDVPVTPTPRSRHGRY